MSLKTSRMIKTVSNTIKKISILYGKISSGNSSTVNIQNTINSEIRDLRLITSYGIASCPTDGLFAQMLINDNNNNVCIGVHNPNAPIAQSGEIIIYSSHQGSYIKIDKDGNITIKGVNVSIEASNDVTINGTKVNN